MQLTLRTKIFIIGGLIIAFLLAVGLALFFLKDKNKKNGTLFAPNTTVENTETKKTGEPSYNNAGPQNQVIEATNIITTYAPDEIYTKQLASMFVERFNTYSNRANNVNIDDALALSTRDMSAWLNSQRIKQEGEYRGVTTKVLSSVIKSITSEKARIEVSMEEITYQAGSQTSKFRTSLVDLVKIGNEWKVNRFYWQE